LRVFEYHKDFLVKYLEDSERFGFFLCGDGFIVENAITTDTGDVELQLAGDALLVVDNPQRFFGIDFDSGEL
jgi:hypothetical protein